MKKQKQKQKPNKEATLHRRALWSKKQHIFVPFFFCVFVFFFFSLKLRRKHFDKPEKKYSDNTIYIFFPLPLLTKYLVKKLSLLFFSQFFIIPKTIFKQTYLRYLKNTRELKGEVKLGPIQKILSPQGFVSSFCTQSRNASYQLCLHIRHSSLSLGDVQLS